MKKVNHRLNHTRSRYGQPGTMNLYGSVYDQLGIDLSLLWQSMIDLFLYGREPPGSNSAHCFRDANLV